MPEFLEEMPDEALDRIYALNWHREKKGDGVVILDLQKHDVINVTVSGTVEIDGVVHGFIIDDGDRGGTEIRDFGDPELVGVAEEPEIPEPITFVPSQSDLYRYRKFALYLHMRQDSEFNNKLRGLSYDRYHAPGIVTEKHYGDYADKRHLKIGYISDFPKDVAEIITLCDYRKITVSEAMDRIFAIYPPEETQRRDERVNELIKLMEKEES